MPRVVRMVVLVMARRGEVVRFYLTNTANTRVFNVRLPGARMKLVGADSGHYEREELVEEVLIAPSERVVVDTLFEETGEVTLVHRTPDREYLLASIEVAERSGDSAAVILPRDGVAEPNLVWKDTVLVRTGETVDILLDVTNPGLWMAHCHIAEHHEAGMMFSFQVDDV